MSIDLAPLEKSTRLLFTIELRPLQGDRFQPTGFPSLGAATYQSRDGAKLLVETLGHRRWILPLPGFARGAVAHALGRPRYPARFVLRDLEALARGLLPLHLNAYKHLAVEPRGLREGLALAAGMVVPLRKKGEGRYGAWHAPEKKGILWRRKK